MSRTMISIENLSKAYSIGAKIETADTLVGALKDCLIRPLRNLKQLRNLDTFRRSSSTDDSPEVFWAVKDVSFEVETGEVVGIVGRNGAGKSTLLKMLSRVTEPTRGRAVIRGRIGSLLEVGTGFHPELSGRENVYMNGTVLGMSKREIDRKFDEIVDFSGVEKFLDTPIKRYSSGMQVRLAFAVAAHLEPEILIVDEVLAVGDAEFQRKCLGKMHDVAQAGQTVIFVSHNLAAVRALCTSGVLLRDGKVALRDNTENVIASYRSSFEVQGLRPSRTWERTEAPGNDKLRVRALHALPLNGDVIDVESGVEIILRIECLEKLNNLDATFEVRTLDDVVVFHEGHVFTAQNSGEVGLYEVRMAIPSRILNTGHYRICMIFGQNRSYLVFGQDDLLTFEVAHVANRSLRAKPGVVCPRLEFTSRYLVEEPVDMATKSREY